MYFGTSINTAQFHTGYDNFVCRIIMLVCLKANMYVKPGTYFVIYCSVRCDITARILHKTNEMHNFVN